MNKEEFKNKNMEPKKYDHLSPDELHEMIEEICKEQTKYWTDDDRAQINASMKNIATLPIWKAIYQAKKWAFLTARASVVKIESEEERNTWFDQAIEFEEILIEQIKDEKK